MTCVASTEVVLAVTVLLRTTAICDSFSRDDLHEARHEREAGAKDDGGYFRKSKVLR